MYKRQVEDTYSPPGVWDGVSIAWIATFGFLHILGINVFNIWYIAVVKFCQHVIFCHLLNHVVGRADYVIIYTACFYYRIHFLVGFKQVIDDINACFLLKFLNHRLVDIFAPIVDVEFVGGLGCIVKIGGGADRCV